MKIVISSGHGLHVRGASDLIDEVDEARAVVKQVVSYLHDAGHEVTEIHDDVSRIQDENLRYLVDAHNSAGPHDIDVSVHFNCYVPTSGGRGTEVLYVNHDIEYVAAKVSAAIAEAGGLINRGSHHRADLYWLNKTLAPAILIECLFVDAQADVDAYEENFNAICRAIADCAPAAAPTRIEAALPVLRVKGKCSWFGGPEDINGVGPDEGLAFIHEVSQKPELFLPEQPPGTTGLARRLDGQNVDYIALRWDYDVYSKDYLRSNVWARVRAPSTGKEFLAIPADWGPHADTGRQADLSPGLMERLELMTDEVVEVEFPISRPE